MSVRLAHRDDADVVIDLRLIVPRSHFDELAAELRRGDVRLERLRARSFDTEDGRLAARAVSLRLRHEGGGWVQTVKAPTPDPALQDGTSAGDAHRDALGHADEPRLVERFRTDVDRVTRLKSLDVAVVELALDTGQVVADDRSDPISEFELELKSRQVQALFDLASRWAIDRRAGPAHFLAAVFSTCLERVLGNASELGVGHTGSAWRSCAPIRSAVPTGAMPSAGHRAPCRHLRNAASGRCARR